MRRPVDRVTLLLLLACLGVTLQVEAFGRTYEQAGALNGELFWSGAYWRAPVTVLLHGGWWHLVLNGLALYLIGPHLARACGATVYFLAVLGGALAGLAASLLTHDPGLWLVGISGGVMGLLGLVLALEWSAAGSWRAFVRRRNTIVVAVFLAINVAIAIAVERASDRIRLDHAAHAAGLAFGLLGGVALYTREGLRPLRGALVALLLVVPALGAAAYPFWNPDFFAFRAAQARERGDREAEARALARLLALDPGRPLETARLATLRDEPALLEDLEGTGTTAERVAIVRASLELARRRLGHDEAAVRALVARAARVPVDAWPLWLAFADEAERAGLAELAAEAFGLAARDRAESEAWREAARALALQERRLQAAGLGPVERLQRSFTAVELALRAAGGLREGALEEGEERDARKASVARLAEVLEASSRILVAARPPPEGLPALHRSLRRLWQRLADNTREETLAGAFLFRSACWWWREIGGASGAPEEREAVLNRMRAALEAARQAGDRRTEGLVGLWLRERGLALPGGDLAGGHDGG